MKKLYFKENWSYVLGILIGAGIAVVGIKILQDNPFYGSYSSCRFGADFYTEMHKVTTSAVNSLWEIYALIRTGIGWCMIGGGLTEAVLCAGRLTSHKREEVIIAANPIDTITEEADSVDPLAENE